MFLFFIFRLWEGFIFLIDWIHQTHYFYALFFLLMNFRSIENYKEYMRTENYKEYKTHKVGKFLRMGISCPPVPSWHWKVNRTKSWDRSLLWVHRMSFLICLHTLSLDLTSFILRLPMFSVDWWNKYNPTLSRWW